MTIARRRRAGLFLAAVFHAAAIGCGHAAASQEPSALALPVFHVSRVPSDLVAQRTIDREWPSLQDSGAVQPRPGERSAPTALALSAAFPGAGQAYAKRRAEALSYAAAEIAGWVSYVLLRQSGDRLRDDAVVVAGAPVDSTSGWSFSRWEGSTGGDASSLRDLYSADRDAFYQQIAADERYSAGWSDGGTRNRYGDLRRRSDRRFETARWTGAGLWINHVTAAMQALRAARLGNMKLGLGHQVQLKARGNLHRGRPHLVLALERRF